MFSGIDNKINLYYYDRQLEQITGGFIMSSLQVNVLVGFLLSAFLSIVFCIWAFSLEDSKQNDFLFTFNVATSLFFVIAGLINAFILMCIS